MNTEVHDRPELARFELLIDGQLVGFADYVRRGDVVEIPHTEIEPSRRGHGLGADLVRGALAHIRAEGATVVPTCSFVADYLAAHPEDQDLLGAETVSRPWPRPAR